MQTALLSARKRTATGEYRAALTVAGRTVLAWQADIAKQLKCKRFICLCDQTTDEILDLQRNVEAEGFEFHAIRSSLQLIALLRAEDSLLVIADGLLAEADYVASIAMDESKLRRAVFTLPADHELPEKFPEDFERIDAARSWAGILAMRAASAQKLADFPPDGDPVSLLLRLALQTGTEIDPFPFGEGQSERLLLATDAAVTERHEQDLVARASPGLSLVSPGQAGATALVRLLAPFGIANGPITSSAVAVALGATGALLAYQEYPAIGLALLSLAAFAGAMSRAWSDLSGAVLRQKQSGKYARLLSDVIDILALIAIIFALRDYSLSTLSVALFAIGLSRAASRGAPAAIAPFWNDRAVHLAIFSVSAVYGVLSEAVAVFGLVALAQIMLDQARKPLSKDK
ncbi:hypothetical protein [Erythrobacter sp. THAF29]|uniref:hypothetical protein n=1 Tax=Erythrobacter sp. THAF29 TaxID=2587851 RepID=UPI0012687EE3|nr:hypothetical protein [Erythrobacter sp. THAF29]QFT77978.1 hypothetical protein FIU90_10565 [Erythrobacter sp. THAF29]